MEPSHNHPGDTLSSPLPYNSILLSEVCKYRTMTAMKSYKKMNEFKCCKHTSKVNQIKFSNKVNLQRKKCKTEIPTILEISVVWLHNNSCTSLLRQTLTVPPQGFLKGCCTLSQCWLSNIVMKTRALGFRKMTFIIYKD